MARSTVAVRFTGDTAALKRSIDDADGKLNNLGSKLAGMGRTVAIGVGAGAVALGGLGKIAVDAGSDLNETLSKSNTVFGEQAKAIESWADGASKAFGQSKQQALNAASSFGNMFSQLGIGDEQAASMSRSMTELASDFASFHNADISEVLSAQEAAFRGEYDAVQRFVPTINAAAVEQKALEMGLADSTKELDAQDKALATQALLMEGAGDAAGDFARTSDGLANKQRIMSAQFEDVKAKIGQALIPMVTRLADVFLNTVIPAVQNMAATVQQHWPQIQAVIQGAVEGIRSFVEPIVGALQALWDNFGNNVLSFVERVWPAIQQVIEGVMTTIRGIIQTVTSLIQGDWSGVWEGIKNVFSGVWNAIQGILRSTVEQLRLVLSVGLETLGSMFRGAWDGIVNFFTGVPGRISSIASGMWDGIKNAFKSAINWIIRAWNGLEFEIPGFDPPGPGPSFGGFTLGVPNIPTLHDGGTITPTGVEPLRSDERYAKLQVGETVYPKGASAGVVINVGTLSNATLADLEQSVAFMFAARGL